MTVLLHIGPLFALLATALLAACGPSEQQKAKWAEERRVHCLDHICEGDRPPKVSSGQVVQKLHGEWYVAPREYFGGFGQATFWWWEHKPHSSKNLPGALQAEVLAGNRDGYSVEIFFSGRQHWPDQKAEKPWENNWWQSRMAELQARGFRMERADLSPELERVRFIHADGTPYDNIFFVAIGMHQIRGNGPPVIACSLGAKPDPDDSCSGGDYWQPDVFARYRFNARHAPDWPVIHGEIVRVLSLTHKATP
jgi:hypothetical protein